ncbi:MAG: hypothetical protein ACR2M1_08430 [Gemmatimonadaceae bacterium]
MTTPDQTTPPADVRKLVARAIEEAGLYARFTLVEPSAGTALPATPTEAGSRQIALVTYDDVPPFGPKTIRIEFWPGYRRVRPFCPGCLSGCCGHALRVGAVFRAAIAGDLAHVTRYIRSEAADGVTDDDLARLWRDREAAREATASAARNAAKVAAAEADRLAALAKAEEERTAKVAQRANGTDLPLFVNSLPTPAARQL